MDILMKIITVLSHKFRETKVFGLTMVITE